MGDLLLSQVVLWGFTTSQLIYFGYISTLMAFAASLSILLYKHLRPKLPARVNCWFCNVNALVPYETRNGWDCPQCDQYNGFTPEGDYNKDVLGRRAPPPDCAPAREEPSNGLCRLCNINQQLKVQQLANFTAMDEHNYDQEIDHFREQLEKCYKLCNSCVQTLNQTLEKQKYHLLTDRLNRHCPAVATPPAAATRPAHLFLQVAMRWTSFLLLATLFLFGFAAYTPAPLSYLVRSMVDWRDILAVGVVVYVWSRKGRASLPDMVVLCLCLVAQVLLYTGPFSLILLFASTSLLLYNRTLSLRVPSFHKKQPPKKIDTNFMNETPPRRTSSNLSAMVMKNLNKKTENWRKVDDGEGKSGKVVPRETVVSPSHGITEEPTKVQTRSQTLKKLEVDPVPRLERATRLRAKSPEPVARPERVATPLPAAQPDRVNRPRYNSPPPEIYAGLNGLHLSLPGDTEKPSQPRNFLTDPVNFGKNGSKLSGLLKPARFLGHSGLSGPADEPETSRSSTPSSSGSIPEQTAMPFSSPMPPQSPVGFGKALSPVYGKYSPPGYGGYAYDFNPPVHSVHPPFFSQGFNTPFPMGHTTVYTYTQPSSFPFGFPHKGMTPPFDYSPMSPRVSEVGSTTSSENLFESYQANSRWSTLKRILFTSSVIINACSLLFLAFSYVYPLLAKSPH